MSSLEFDQLGTRLTLWWVNAGDCELHFFLSLPVAFVTFGTSFDLPQWTAQSGFLKVLIIHHAVHDVAWPVFDKITRWKWLPSETHVAKLLHQHYHMHGCGVCGMCMSVCVLFGSFKASEKGLQLGNLLGPPKGRQPRNYPELWQEKKLKPLLFYLPTIIKIKYIDIDVI